MNESEKQQIKAKLAEFCEIKGGQNKASNTLTGVSAATVSQILNNNWEQIRDEMWRTISSQIGCNSISQLVVATEGYNVIRDFLADAQEHALVIGIIGNEGCGKTISIRNYASNNRNVYHLRCADYWNRRFFVTELARIIGITTTNSSVPDMMREIILALKKLDHPMIVIDEVDKLTDQLLYFFISLYNDLEDFCALVVAATPYFKTRLSKGVERNRKGFREIYSRLGRRLLYVPIPNTEDIIKVCKLHGILNKATIEDIISDSDCDLRRVARKIHAAKKQCLNAN